MRMALAEHFALRSYNYAEKNVNHMQGTSRVGGIGSVTISGCVVL